MKRLISIICSATMMLALSTPVATAQRHTVTGNQSQSRPTQGRPTQSGNQGHSGNNARPTQGRPIQGKHNGGNQGNHTGNNNAKPGSSHNVTHGGIFKPGTSVMPQKPVVNHRPSQPVRPIVGNHHSRPVVVTPPHRPYRPVMLRPKYRPTPPPAWRPAGHAPVLRTILGLTFGSAIGVSLDYLYNAGYSIDGYGNDIVYLRNVPLMNYVWTDGALYYGTRGLDTSSFYYSTPHYDMSRYNGVYGSLVNQFGAPVSIDRAGGTLTSTWFAPGNGFITLSFGAGNAGRWLTTLTVGL